MCIRCETYYIEPYHNPGTGIMWAGIPPSGVRGLGWSGFGIVFRAEYTSLEKLLKNIHEGKIKKGDVDKDLWLNYAQKLYQGVEEGYGKKILEVDFESKDYNMLNKMRENVYVFSAFKTYQEIRAVTDLLTNDKGEVRSFSEFKREAINLHEGTYDGRFLQAEYNNAVLSATAASQWMDIEDAKEELPLLRYSTAKDANVRPEHAALDGIILPVDDPFWNAYFPPNDWGCRCDVEQLPSGKVTDKSKIVTPENKPMFQNNVGKTGVVFPETHPYYKVAKEDKEKAKNLWGLQIPQISHQQQSNAGAKNTISKDEQRKIRELYKNKSYQLDKIGDIKISRRGIDEIVSKAAFDSELKIEILRNLDFVLTKAKYLYSAPNDKLELKPFDKQYHYFKAKFKGIEIYPNIVEMMDGTKYLYTVNKTISKK